MSEKEEPNDWVDAMARGAQFCKETKCTTLEILHSPSLAEPLWLEGEVDDESVLEWLDTIPSQPCPDKQSHHQPYTSGLRILMATAAWRDAYETNRDREHNGVYFSIRKDTYEHIQRRLHLPDYFISLLTSYSTRGFRYTSPTTTPPSNNENFFWRTPQWRSDFIQTSLTHSPVTNLTTALLIHASTLHAPSFIHQNLLSFSSPLPHPLLLPILLLNQEILSFSKHWQYVHWKLDEFGASAGQFAYGGKVLMDPLSLNYMRATRELAAIGEECAGSKLAMKCVLLAVEQVEMWGRWLDLQKKNNNGKEQEKEREKGGSEVYSKARIEYLRDTCNTLLLEAECEKSRIEALSRAVYQFMAAKDAKTNLRLAETSAIIAKASKEDSAVMRSIAIESKRDSSAMKTIAILGMVFLPGTFVAAIFGMPVFGWDGNGDLVVKKGFGVYWAVTIPLTVLVLTVWGLGMFEPWKRLVGKEKGLWKVRSEGSKDEADVI